MDDKLIAIILRNKFKIHEEDKCKNIKNILLSDWDLTLLLFNNMEEINKKIKELEIPHQIFIYDINGNFIREVLAII